MAFTPTPRIAPVRCLSAELIGFDLVESKKHTTGIVLNESACAMLTQKLNLGRAHVLKVIVPTWKGYNNMVYWPGVGAFACQLSMTGR